MSLPRPCYRCGAKMLNPGRTQKICDKCYEIARVLGQARSSRKFKVYTRCCKKCNTIYRTIYRYSKFCPKCDNSKNKIKRSLNKKIVTKK